MKTYIIQPLAPLFIIWKHGLENSGSVAQVLIKGCLQRDMERGRRGLVHHAWRHGMEFEERRYVSTAGDS